jgi:hypothetical protein
MMIGYEQWHDGVGYDLDALRAAAPEERASIETLLLGRGARDWRDVEALALIDTPRARTALAEAFEHGDHALRDAVIRFAPDLVSSAERTSSLVRALRSAVIYEGLTQALEMAAEFHPPEVIAELFRGVLRREGEVAVHFAAMLLFLHGKAAEPFDWELRPFFLRFNTEDGGEREAAFRELCGMIEVDPAPFLSVR